MGKAKKRSRAIVKDYSGPTIKSRRLARKLTTEFHRIHQELTQLQELEEAEGSGGTSKVRYRQKRMEELQKQLDEMGGREMYQEASAISTEHFKSSRFVFQQLTKQGLRPQKKQPKLRVLEIGAVNTQLVSCPWMNVRAIDLRSRDPKIEETDFFNISTDAKPTEQETLMYRNTACSACQEKTCHGIVEEGRSGEGRPEEVSRKSLRYGGEYDVIVNSMVINSVFEPSSRGEMLKKCYTLLRPGGRLFLMLPRRCIEKSPVYSTHDFLQCLNYVGFRFVFWRNTPKIAMLCLIRPAICECSCHTNDSWLVLRPFESESVPPRAVSKIRSLQKDVDSSVPKWPWEQVELVVPGRKSTTTHFAITLDTPHS
eukprot:gb/GECG01006817.1/.p1 GENE.gb/GECG01006817.1/~~gb/GECG01006817.1/.p1  ORF type:complete len:369 (+),score=44.88 gb/GECG01006817.1/:1-1107(+)